jgi:hypothetical protein
MFGIGDISIHSLYLSDGAGGWGLILHPMGLTILFALLHFRAQLDIDVCTQSDTPFSLRDYYRERLILYCSHLLLFGVAL